MTLYNCQLPDKASPPGKANCIRIKIDNQVPTTLAKPPKIKYKVPMSLWFVEKKPP